MFLALIIYKIFFGTYVIRLREMGKYFQNREGWLFGQYYNNLFFVIFDY